MTETEIRYIQLIYAAWVNHESVLQQMNNEDDFTLKCKKITGQTRDTWQLFLNTAEQYGVLSDTY